jgi:transposase-like protein
MRKKIEASLKAKVALEAIKGEKTLAQISSQYGVHVNLIGRWKQELLKNCAEIFNKHKDREKAEQKEKISQLYKSIGELKYENDWLKKKLELLD